MIQINSNKSNMVKCVVILFLSPIFFMRVVTSLKSRRGSREHNRMKPEPETSFYSFISMLCLQQNNEKDRHQSFQKERSTKRSNMLFLDPQFSWDPARSEYVNIFWKTEIFAYNLRWQEVINVKCIAACPKHSGHSLA